MSYSNFRSEIFREDVEISVIDDYSTVRRTREPTSKKVTILVYFPPVPVFMKDSDRITGIEKVGQDSLDDEDHHDDDENYDKESNLI